MSLGLHRGSSGSAFCACFFFGFERWRCRKTRFNLMKKTSSALAYSATPGVGSFRETLGQRSISVPAGSRRSLAICFFVCFLVFVSNVV